MLWFAWWISNSLWRFIKEINLRCSIPSYDSLWPWPHTHTTRRDSVATVTLALLPLVKSLKKSMNKFFLPTSKKVLSTFQTFCPVGGPVCPAQTVVHFVHCQVQASKSGVLGWVWRCFVYVHIPERGVWLLSKEQELGVVFWAKWDPIWAKWDSSGQYVQKVGKSALELGKKKYSIMTMKLKCGVSSHIQSDSDNCPRDLETSTEWKFKSFILVQPCTVLVQNMAFFTIQRPIPTGSFLNCRFEVMYKPTSNSRVDDSVENGCLQLRWSGKRYRAEFSSYKVKTQERTIRKTVTGFF